MYVGYSPLHSSTVGLVRNLKTGNISPQFHLVFDDWFETVHSSPNEEPAVWKELVQFQSFSNEFDDDQYVPELGKEWLNEEEKQQREERDRNRREHGNVRNETPRQEEPEEQRELPSLETPQQSPQQVPEAPTAPELPGERPPPEPSLGLSHLCVGS